MKNLLKVLNALKLNRKDGINYVIPKHWFLEELEIEYKVLPTNEVLLNPYDFYIALIESILNKGFNNIDYSKSLSQSLNTKSSNGDWIKKSTIYSMMIRTSSSYDSDRSFSLDISNINGLKETGTFIKTLALLPLLLRLGVNVLYLLPISKYSKVGKKGELGSPYSVESFTELDELLKDTMTGNDTTINEEFGALVEACHILNIRVTIDIIPRTASVYNSLIKEHPEWFYWIKSSEYDSYRAPIVDGIGDTIYPSEDMMEPLFSSPDTIRHIKMFQMNPKENDPVLYDSINENDTVDFINKINELYGLKVAPAFSDQINDIQPAWSDVTYFRIYLDDPIYTKKYLKIKHNPYILSDTIKSNLYPGRIPNIELWEYLSNIIPYYQKEFGIDGARIDMGHALPIELLNMIFKKAKDIDPDFSFIAEELNMDNDKASLEKGYNAMIGNGFYMLNRASNGNLKYFINNMYKKVLPSFAAAETHDTKRVSMRDGKEAYSRFITILNYFIPNTIPFINSGQEMYEKEPMNLGLDSTIDDIESLDKDDIFYHKLALFDKYQFHYNNPNSFEIINHLVDVIKTRTKWLNIITDIDNYKKIEFNIESNTLIGIGYKDIKTNKGLLIIGNANIYESVNIEVKIEEFRNEINNHNNYIKLLYSTFEFPRTINEYNDIGNLNLYLRPLEIKIIEIE